MRARNTMAQPVGLAISSSFCASPSLGYESANAPKSRARASSQTLTPRTASQSFSPHSLPRSYASRRHRGGSQQRFLLSDLGLQGLQHLSRWLKSVTLLGPRVLGIALALSILVNLFLLRHSAESSKMLLDDWLVGYQEGFEEALQHNEKLSTVAPPPLATPYASLWSDMPRPQHKNITAHSRFPTTPVEPSDVCVLMSDSRPLSPIPEDLIGHGKLPFPTTSAYLNMHWALRHGYRFIHRGLQGREKPGYHVTWWRLPGMMETIRECEYTVFFDGDAFVNSPEYSLDDMRLRWGMHDRASILMANEAIGQPIDNMNTTNFGFLIIRRSEVSLKALKDLLECPETIPECEHRKRDFSHEQKAFADFVRPTLEDGVDFVVAPCDEANGFWSFWGECHGGIVTHAWLGKDDVAERTVGILARESLRFLERYAQHPHESRGRPDVQLLPS